MTCATLRSRLDIDSGYASRLLRSLEAAGLVAVGPGDGDRRVRRARLTPAGRTERAVLDRRAEALAAGLLAPLTDAPARPAGGGHGRGRAAAHRSARRGRVTDPADPDARCAWPSTSAELDRRFDAGFDPGRSLPLDRDEMLPPAGLFVVARLRGAPVGCGAFKRHDDGSADLKRMWVAPAARGLGVGRRLLADLESRARAAGPGRPCSRPTARSPRRSPSTARPATPRSPPFNDEPYAHHWFAKPL